MTRTRVYVGIDVSKATLDIGTSDGETWQVANDDRAMEPLRERLGALQPALVVLEATGSYEARAAAALASIGLPVAVVNPRQVRHFARATGALAKTDRIDAHVLARFAQAVQPEPRPLPDAEAQELEALLTRRRQLLDMLVAEESRRETALPAIARRSSCTSAGCGGGWARRTRTSTARCAGARCGGRKRIC